MKWSQLKGEQRLKVVEAAMECELPVEQAIKFYDILQGNLGLLLANVGKEKKPAANFSERLKYAVKKSGMTQQDLAKKINVPPSAITQYLAGKNMPKPERIQELADATGVSVGLLIGEEPLPLVPTKVSPNITLNMAAKCLHISPQALRQNILSGSFPIGKAIPTSGRNLRYVINPDKLREEVGETRFNEFFGTIAQD